MKRFLPIALAVAVVTGCSSLSGGTAMRAEHTIVLCDSIDSVFRSDTLRLGKVRSGETIVQGLRVENRSAETIVVERIECGCPCLRTEFDYSPVKSGEIRDLKIVFDTYGLAGWVLRRADIHVAGMPSASQIWIEADVRQ